MDNISDKFSALFALGAMRGVAANLQTYAKECALSKRTDALFELKGDDGKPLIETNDRFCDIVAEMSILDTKLGEMKQLYWAAVEEIMGPRFVEEFKPFFRWEDGEPWLDGEFLWENGDIENFINSDDGFLKSSIIDDDGCFANMKRWK